MMSPIAPGVIARLHPKDNYSEKEKGDPIRILFIQHLTELKSSSTPARSIAAEDSSQYSEGGGTPLPRFEQECVDDPRTS
ncbi:hypothetical protein CEXT_465281 [Caerostris extrusa]|uniref:Uncharacterized protein n=1 Tax=Caerostris extrusa TaxID=172846 RepID=A0AAV4PAC2_CAEEX|nr:hypothetical protein CEXT_465281 [Caerostris extrusa]